MTKGQTMIHQTLEDVNRPLQSPKNDKRTNNDSPNITQKTKDREK
jgi:hypothetical protein